MIRTILFFGLAAGAIVAVPMFAVLALNPEGHGGTNSMFFGYTMMVVALSLVFFGVKQHRDKALGGVIRFWPALLMGLGISFVASLVYVAGWETTLALTRMDFIGGYAETQIAAAKAKGMAGAELDALVRQMDEMKAQYANPLFRLPMTFVEIFPVGLLVSLVTAALLRNSRFLPARAAA